MGKDPNSLVNSKFYGPKGRLMLELQKSFRDDRFKLTKKFQDDIDVNKLSNSFKQTVDKEILKEPEEKSKKEETEQEHQLYLLQSLGIRKKIAKKPLEIVHRFDPSTAKSQKLLKDLYAEKRRKQIYKNTYLKRQKKQKVSIQKGIDRAKNNIEKANQLLTGEEKHHQPLPRNYEVKINGSKAYAFQSSDFKLF